MIAEWIARGEVRDVMQLGFFLSEAHCGDLWLGENDVRQEPIIHFSRRIRMSNVVSRNFPLLDRNMDNLVRPRAIADRVNKRLIRLHERIGQDRTKGSGDAG